MLCDSVGIVPAPNNGTLRLPLKPIGLHDGSATNGLEPPADPVETHAATSPKPEPTTNTIVANPVSTSGSESTAPATNPILVNPVAPTNTVGVDQPVPTPQPSQQPSGSGSDSGSDSGNHDSSTVDKVQDFWDWFSGKVTGWWGKVTGQKDQGGAEGGEEATSSS